MLAKRRNLGNVFLAIGSLIMLIEIVGMLTGTLSGPEILYFLGGAFEGIGVVFVLEGFLIRKDYIKNREMI